MLKTMKLLVAIDSSPTSQQVLEEIVRRPWPSGTTACVLHIIERPPIPGSASLIEILTQTAESLVKAASAKLDSAGVKTTTKVFDGQPRVAVPEYAKQWGADLVLVGSHGASGLVRFLLGSVAQAALRKSPCSVEIVRRSARNPATPASAKKILMATDGSDCAMAAVKSVAERPWLIGSRVRVISVIPVVTSAIEMISPLLASAHRDSRHCWRYGDASSG